jgi:hypothetical protein
MAEAQFRANWTKLTLKWLRQLPAPHGDQIREVIGHPTLEQVGRAGVFEWLPATIHMRVAGAVRSVLGPTARSFWRDLMRASLQRSLLKALAEGGLRLFGRTPHAVLRMTPQAYSLIARGCGVIDVTAGPTPGSAILTFDALPAELRVPAWVDVCAGNCEAVLDLLELPGTVSEDARGLGAGRFVVVTTPRS